MIILCEINKAKDYTLTVHAKSCLDQDLLNYRIKMTNCINYRVTSSKNCNCSVLELPLDHPGCSLYLILPNEVSGFAELEKLLSDQIVDEIIDENLEAKPRKLRVKIPRYKKSTSYNITATLL